VEGEVRKLEEDLEKAYERMWNQLAGVAQGRLRLGQDDVEVDAAFLRRLDPAELKHLHFGDLRFEGAEERYRMHVAQGLEQAEELLRAGKRDALARHWEQVFMGMELWVVGRGMKRGADGAEITPELLARLSLDGMRRTLDVENVRFPLTGQPWLSVPHQLGGENFQRVVWDNAEKIEELHERLDAAKRQLVPADALDDAIVQVAQLFADTRDYHYLDQAIADETYMGRLRRWGESDAELNGLVEGVLATVGAWEALPGQTLALRGKYRDHPGLPGHGQAAMERTWDHWLEEAQASVEAIYARGKVSDQALTPVAREPKTKSGWGRLKFWEKDEDDTYHLADSWQVSENRRQLFEQEIRVYAEALRLIDDPRLKERLGTEIAVVTGLRSLDDEIVAEILAPEPEEPEAAPEASAPAGGGRGSARPGDHGGMVGALGGGGGGARVR
jgi:hypothetical protein